MLLGFLGIEMENLATKPDLPRGARTHPRARRPDLPDQPSPEMPAKILPNTRAEARVCLAAVRGGTDNFTDFTDVIAAEMKEGERDGTRMAVGAEMTLKIKSFSSVQSKLLGASQSQITFSSDKCCDIHKLYFTMPLMAAECNDDVLPRATWVYCGIAHTISVYYYCLVSATFQSDLGWQP